MSKFVGAHYYKKPSTFQSMRHKYKTMRISGLVIRLPIIFLLIPLIVGGSFFYIYIIKELPDLKQIESLNLSQTTTITDRNGEPLYRVFDENRDYVPISKISTNMQNAIIAAEDNTFWSNIGIDFVGIARAAFKDITSDWSTEGGSTITQQLVKNLLLTPEKSIKRKLKELVLTLQLGSVLDKQIAKSDATMTWKERDRKVKEKVLELYLNYIFLGNNNYGVQAASKSFFGTNAADLWVFESSVLASIPKAPSRYDPYKNRALLVGELQVINSLQEKVTLDDAGMKELINKIRSILDDSKIKNRTNSADMMKYTQWLIDFDFTYNNELYKIKYILGRKDYVLSRMYEDNFITIEEFKDALLQGMTYTFSKSKITLDSPHFVFRILDLLKDPNNKYIGEYGEDMLKKWGLIIRTTLDLKIQQMALDSIQESIGTIKGYGGNNTALIHIDSKNGDVLAYVWSADYYNEAIDGNVDVIQRERQPGSSIKPFFYALGFIKNPLTIDTAIFDIPFKLGSYEPDNADGGFMGPLPLRKALAYSRNIPAIKMYFAVGEQKGFIEFAKALWVFGFDESKEYGPPMAIGSAEMKMFDLAKMYTHLSATGKPGEIDPILEIRRPDGSLLYKKSDARPTQVIPSGVAYLMWKILSDPANLPPDWARKFAFSGIKFASKTGTSNWRQWDKILPRDGWLATYTPSKVSLFWAGNTSGKPMHADAYGGWVNRSTWNKFWTKLKTSGYLRDEDMKPVEVKQLTVAKYSGKLATDSTPAAMRVSTWAYINNLPTEFDAGSRKVQLDKLCMGKVSDLTPARDIVTVYINEPQTFMPDKRDLPDIMKYTGQGISVEMLDANGERITDNVYVEPTQECIERRFGTGVWTGIIDKIPWMNASIIKPTQNEAIQDTVSLRYNVSASEEITSVQIIVNGSVVNTVSYDKSVVTDMKTLDLKAINGSTITLGIKAFGKSWKTSSASVQVEKKEKNLQNQMPTLLTNQTTVKLENGIYKVSLFFTDPDGTVKNGVIKKGGSTISNFNGSISSLELSNLGTLEYSVTDNQGGTNLWSVDLTALGN